MKYVIFLLAALPAFSQFGMRPPDMPGMFRPVVGAGAEYHISSAQKKDMTVAFAIVGQEDGGYWMEIRTSNNGQPVVMKQLMAGEPAQPKRMIVQANGRPPMEIPMGMANMMGPRGGGAMASGSGTGTGSMGTKIGVESITVPAGTFECEHFSNTANGKQSDVWISTKVAPYGVVKAAGSTGQMELLKVLDHETSQIKGEPQKINIPGRP